MYQSSASCAVWSQPNPFLWCRWMNQFHLRGIRPLCNSVTGAGILDDESCTCRRDVTDLIESLEFLSTCTILEGRPIFHAGRLCLREFHVGRILFVKFRRGKKPPHEQTSRGQILAPKLRAPALVWTTCYSLGLPSCRQWYSQLI